ncbi:MAG: dimethylargininase [Lysobacter sp.]|nr:dimethylargininase [Lysobacter sp.]
MTGIVAIVRRPAPTLAQRCELTFLEREAIDFDAAERQHAAYRDALAAAGARTIVLDAIASAPDSVFVEDAAVVLDEVAILANPGADSRRREPDFIAAPLSTHRRCIERIAAPGTLEGGDVLVVGDTLYVGLSGRSNREGLEQLASIARRYGYATVPVRVHGSLHLKTACTALDATTVLLNPAWVDATAFDAFERIETADDEPFAANVLPIGATLLANAAFPRTLVRVRAHAERAGFGVRAVDISEFGKAEAGLTCMSLVFETDTMTTDATLRESS